MAQMINKSVKTSFKSFVTRTNKRRETLRQQISVKSNILLRGNMRKCLACHGIPRITPEGNVTGFQSCFTPYNHQINCPQINKF